MNILIFFFAKSAKEKGGGGSGNSAKNPLSQTRCICGRPLRLFLMCLEETSFGNCSDWENGGQMIHFGERCIWGEPGVGENFAN